MHASLRVSLVFTFQIDTEKLVKEYSNIIDECKKHNYIQVTGLYNNATGFIRGDNKMITLMNDLPDHVIGLTASAKITGEDYEKVLIPAVEAKLKTYKKISILYCLGKDFERFTAGAMWDDTKLGMMHLLSWDKAAVVTDVGWIRNATRLFSALMPCHVKIFAEKDLDEAKKWVSE